MLSETELCERICDVFRDKHGQWHLHSHDDADQVIISWRRTPTEVGESLVVQSTDGDDHARGISRSIAIIGRKIVMDTHILPADHGFTVAINYSCDRHSRYSPEYNETMEYAEHLLGILQIAEDHE